MNHHEVHQIARAVVEDIKRHWEATAIEHFQAQARRLERVEQQNAQTLEMLAELLGGTRITGGAITFDTLTPTGDPPMYIVKDNQAAVPYTITPPTVLDRRGRVLDPQPALTYKVESNPAPDADGSGPGIVVTPDPSNPLSGSVGPFNDNDDGTPLVASLSVMVSLPDGKLVGSIGEQFTIVDTSTDPASIAGGGIAFAGLTPAQP